MRLFQTRRRPAARMEISGSRGIVVVGLSPTIHALLLALAPRTPPALAFERGLCVAAVCMYGAVCLC